MREVIGLNESYTRLILDLYLENLENMVAFRNNMKHVNFRFLSQYKSKFLSRLSYSEKI